jgi:hypothetical protein
MARNMKDVLERVDRITQAWEARRAAKTFSGLSVTQFREKSRESRDARAAIKELETSLQGARKRSKLADAELLKVERRVVLCVRGDEEDGEDSVLYGEMGFVPRSQRIRRARRRSANGAKPPSPGPAPAQATPEKVT